MSEFIEAMRAQIATRLTELEPKVVEFQMLLEMQELNEQWKAAFAQRARQQNLPKREEIRQWVRKLEYEPFSRFQLAHEYGQTRTWASRVIRGMLDDGFIEEFGNGLFRQTMQRTGQARLRVTTK